MSSLERRLVFLSVVLLYVAFMVWAVGGGLQAPTALAASGIANTSTLTYYGADISTNGGMAVATGVQTSNNRPVNGPWPQYTTNYCFVAVVQALANYEYWAQGEAIPFPHQVNEGPQNDDPNDETSGANGTAWQILYDMDHYLRPTFGTITPTGSGSSRRPFTLANISRDFGGDPRAHAVAVTYESPPQHFYHEYVYHNAVAGATYDLAKGVATTFWDGDSPEIAIVDHGDHSVVVAGVWATADPATVTNATIDSFAVYNPWDNQNFPSFLNGAYYARVSYADWTSPTNPDWWGLPYSSNGGADPDPIIGIYQAGPGTSHPNAHYWIGNYVAIHRDNTSTDSADYSINENGQLMTGP
ncbi:MAG TPA: hypothetical protein VKT82_29830 [Ktedonobacterales bacterium]|nr:hypothetical protein [Ktedonobacterales bacterium]